MLLADFRVDVNRRNQNGDASIHIATRAKDRPTFLKLVENPPFMPSTTTKRNGTALHLTVTTKMGDMAVAMIEKFRHQSGVRLGINCCAQNGKGRTVIHAAAAGGQFGVLRILLTLLDADPNIADTKGNAPLHLALRAQEDELPRNAPFWCAYKESGTIAVLLANYWVNINRCNRDGLSAAEVAFIHGKGNVKGLP